jgi:hypothetical protein
VIPVGVVLAGAIFNYSFPGLAWLLGAALIWMLVIALRERDRAAAFFAGLRLGERLRQARSAILLGIAIPVVCALPEIFRLASFSSFKAFNPSGTGPTVGFGNLRQPLNPLEAFGIWPSGEFRITPANSTTPEIAFYLGGLLALAAFAWGLWRALSGASRPALGPARGHAHLSGRPGGRHAVHPGQVPRHRGAVDHGDRPARPPLGRCHRGRGVRRAGEGRAVGWPPRPLRALVPIGVPLLTLAFAAAAAFSTLLPLRQAAVGPDYHFQEMLQMRPIVDGQNVLFLGRDNFVSWELIGSEVYAPITNHYDVEEDARPLPGHRPECEVRLGQRPGLRHEQVQWVVTTSAAMQSQAPPASHRGCVPTTSSSGSEITRSGSDGRSTSRSTPAPHSTVEIRARRSSVRRGALHRVHRPAGRRPGLAPSPELTQSKPAQQRLYLTPGRWDISSSTRARRRFRSRRPAARSRHPSTRRCAPTCSSEGRRRSTR